MSNILCGTKRVVYDADKDEGRCIDFLDFVTNIKAHETKKIKDADSHNSSGETVTWKRFPAFHRRSTTPHARLGTHYATLKLHSTSEALSPYLYVTLRHPHSQRLSAPFINHVTYANSWGHFHEVGRNATIESGDTLFLNDFRQQPGHSERLASTYVR
ncbi:hypothetical protein ACFE04_019889 [Oxalis oulophora]